jgi:hypothetical protein
MVKNIFGKLFGDKGYISQTLFDKIMLRKRALIESINNQLKFVFQIEHHRHRSPINGFVNILCALVAYIHYPNKPSPC